MSACEWPVDETCLPALPDGESDEDYSAAVAQRAAAVSLASDVLWALSGRQYGVCTYIVRPCIQTEWCYRYPSTLVTSYELSWYDWVTWSCGCCYGNCTLSGPGAVHLPGPAQDVMEVVVNGVIL